jgi:hypothetical protein
MGLDFRAASGYNGGIVNAVLYAPELGSNARRNHCEGKGASAMPETPVEDKLGFVAKKPEHRFAWFL